MPGVSVKAPARLGVGLGLHALRLLERPGESRAFLRRVRGCVDYYELSGWRWSEQLGWLGGRRSELDRILDLFPASSRFVLHSTGLNAGSISWHDARAVRFFDFLARELRSPWVLEDLGAWWRRRDGRLLARREMLPAFYPILLEGDWLDAIAANIRRLQGRLSVPFLPELPPFPFLTGRLGFLEALDRLSRASGCDLLLDVGHLASHAATAGTKDLLRRLDRADLSRVVELHVAGSRRHPREPSLVIDSHCDGLEPSVRRLVAFLLPRLPRLRAVTYEIFEAQGREEASYRTLADIRGLCAKHGFGRG